MKYFGDNSDYHTALRRSGYDPRPVTYRMLHEDAAGMGLSDEFFAVSGIDPDAPVKCNCNFDAGHESQCHLVAAHELRIRLRLEEHCVSGKRHHWHQTSTNPWTAACCHCKKERAMEVNINTYPPDCEKELKLIAGTLFTKTDRRCLECGARIVLTNQPGICGGCGQDLKGGNE
jgi:hypothetical protein